MYYEENETVPIQCNCYYYHVNRTSNWFPDYFHEYILSNVSLNITWN